MIMQYPILLIFYLVNLSSISIYSGLSLSRARGSCGAFLSQFTVQDRSSSVLTVFFNNSLNISSLFDLSDKTPAATKHFHEFL